jgi:virulence factor Mce-like protein
MALFKRSGGRGSGGMGPFKVGMIAIVLIAIGTFIGFTRYNPLAKPFELKAAVKSANNLQSAAPVRIAGVLVGKVKTVEPIRGGTGAIVTMEIDKPGLPIHKDAQLKIRPRIFLEGNFFVDIQPGTPSAPVFESGDTVPVQQTATPVQFGQLLTALQSDTREDLKTFLDEYARKGLGNGGAEAYNKMLDDAPDALRNAAIANQASLGRRPHDLSNVLRGQQRLARALTARPQALQNLVTDLNTTAGALAREDAALQQSVPLLRDTLRVATPTLRVVDAALPSLRAFARDATPGVRSSGPAIDASLPFIEQLRLLVRPEELRGLVRDLRPTIPALARLNRRSIGLLNQSRALSACQNNVLLPWAQKPIPNPEEPVIDGEPFYKQAPRGLVGLSSESRLADANSPVFHINGGSGPANVIYTHEGENFIATAPAPPDGTRPAKPAYRPQFRPGEPCELQEVPDLEAQLGTPDPSRVVDNPTGLLPPLPENIGLAKRGEVHKNQIIDSVTRMQQGKPHVDPMTTPQFAYLQEMRKLGLDVLPNGKVKEGGR